MIFISDKLEAADGLLKTLEEAQRAFVAEQTKTPEGQIVLCVLGFLKPECLNEGGKLFLEIGLKANGVEAAYEEIQRWGEDDGGPEE